MSPTRHNASTRASQIAKQIAADIKRRDWPVGEIIGSYPELIEKYAASQTVLREAIRILEHQGVARMRKGPGGGLLVEEPDAGAVSSAVAVYLEYRGIRASDLFGVRQALEVYAVDVLTRKMDEDRAARLRKLMDKEQASLETGTIDRWAFREFHTGVAADSGDPTLHLFVDVLATVGPSLMPMPEPYMPAAREAHEAHAAIVEAMIGGDVGLARHRMLRHVEAMAARAVHLH